MTIDQYGFKQTMLPENSPGIPARVSTVHRELFEFVCDNGAGIAHIKASEYHDGEVPFPTTGDFVLLEW